MRQLCRSDVTGCQSVTAADRPTLQHSRTDFNSVLPAPPPVCPLRQRRSHRSSRRHAALATLGLAALTPSLPRASSHSKPINPPSARVTAAVTINAWAKTALGPAQPS